VETKKKIVYIFCVCVSLSGTDMQKKHYRGSCVFETQGPSKPQVGSCHHDMARPHVTDGRTTSNMEGDANIFNMQSQPADKG
jgi:hypothetical protein